MRYLSKIVFAAFAGFAFFAAGCGSASSGLRVSSEQSGKLFTQSFPEGVADVRDAGDTDLILTARTESAKPGSAPAMTQVLHVQMLWQQGYVVKAANREVSKNASFHWYVYPASTSDGAGGSALVEYTGTGLVELSKDGDRVTVKVAEAHLTPTRVVGAMQDPLGPTTLSGTLTGRTDRAKTVAMLGDLQATVAAAKSVVSPSARSETTAWAVNLMKSRMFFILFISIFYAVGIGMLVYALYSAKRSQEAGSWPTAVGVVDHCSLKRNADSDGDTYQVDVTYHYEVKGQPFTGSRLAFGYNASSGQEAHQQIHDAIQKAKTVLVRYDPEHPEVSTLSYGMHRSIQFVFAFAITWLAFVIGFTLIWWVGSKNDNVLLENLMLR